MTNLIATVALVVTTNWVTTSITRPVCNQPGCLVIHSDVEHQIGARVTNTVASVKWKGEEYQMVIEKTSPFYEGDLRRDVLRSQGTVQAFDTNWMNFWVR
jgi:hypothetical protein